MRERDRRRRRRSVAAVAGMVLLGTGLAACTQPQPLRTLPGTLYGVTADDMTNVAEQVDSARKLAHMPTTRVVLDKGDSPEEYAAALAQLHPVSYILAEPVDSSELKSYSRSGYHDRFSNALSALGRQVDIWEVGNEVNGDWTGGSADVAAKVADATDEVKSAGGHALLTLYDNVGCGDDAGELDPLTWTSRYLPAQTRAKQDYVMLSYYEAQCRGIRPSAAAWQRYFEKLHGLFPQARVGFGEVGLPDPVAGNPTGQREAMSIIDYYYRLPISLPYYCRGGFYWYYAEDMLPQPGNVLWQTLNQALAR